MGSAEAYLKQFQTLNNSKFLTFSLINIDIKAFKFQNINFADSFGLVINLTLCGLAMFFLVLMLSFAGTKILLKQSESWKQRSDPLNRETEHFVCNEECEEDMAINDKSDIFTICERLDEDISCEMIDNETLIASTEKRNKTLKLQNIFSLTKMKKLK